MHKLSANRQERRIKKEGLKRRLTEMLTVPNEGCLDILLSLRTRLLSARTMKTPLSKEDSELIRRLVADMVTVTACLEHLAELFTDSREIESMAGDATMALMRVTKDWMRKNKPAPADLSILEDTAELMYDVLKETKISEYKAVLALVEKELTPIKK